MTSLHPNATTTVKQRKFIQDSELTVSELADMLGVSERTVRRWKGRKATEDYSHTPHRLPTKLTEEQQWFLIEIHNMLRLKLDDLLCIARAFVLPTVSRSALYRCLDRHGETNIKDPLHDIPAKTKQRLQINKPGFVEITERLLPEMPGDTYMLVAKDRASHCVYIEMHERKDASNVMTFLKNVKAHFPFHIRVLSVDQRLGISDERPLPGEIKQICGPLTFFDSLKLPHLEWMLISNGPTTESDNDLRESVSSSRGHQLINLGSNWRGQLSRLAYWYNHRIHQHSIKNLTPFACLQKHYKISPELFTIEPLQPIMQTHLLKEFLYDIFYSLKLIDENINPENIKQTRKGYIKDNNDFKSHQDMFGIYMPMFINLISDSSSGATLFNYSVLEHLYLEIASIPVITLKSQNDIKDCYTRHILLPIIAVIIHANSLTGNEESFFYHMHRMFKSNFDNIQLNTDNLHLRIKLYLRKYIDYLDLNGCHISKKVLKNIKDIGPGKIQTADTIYGMFEFSSKYKNNKQKMKNDALDIDATKYLELPKLLKLKTAYLTMSLISQLGNEPTNMETLVKCYHRLLCNDDELLCLKAHLQELFKLPNLTGQLDIHQVDMSGRNNLKLQFAPLVDLLHVPVRRELSIPTLQVHEHLIHLLKDLVSSPHQSGSDAYDRAVFKPIIDVDLQDWPHRIILFPYSYLIKILNCIQDNKLEDAYELADDAPYGACEQFGFLAYAFSVLYIGLHVRLKKNKLNKNKLNTLSHYIITGQGLVTTHQKSSIAINQLINVPHTNEKHNTLITTPSNIAIMRAVYTYNQLVLKLTCTNGGYPADPIPQAIYGVLDKFYKTRASFISELEKIPLNLDGLARANSFMENTNLTNKDLYSDLIPFLKGSSFKNCISDPLLLIEHLCGPSYTFMDSLEILQFANQHQSIALIYDAHNSG